MAGILNVFNLGAYGINVDANPVNLEDGELTHAQNAIHDPAGSIGGIRKRPGLTKLNAVAVSGSVFGICNVPIAPVATRQFLVGIDQDVTAAYQWVGSTNEFGSTSQLTSPAKINDPEDELQDVGIWTILSSKGAQAEGLFLYPGDYVRGEPIPIRAFDLSVDRELFRIPINAGILGFASPGNIAASTGAIRQMLVEGNKLYIAIHDFHLDAHAFPNFSRVLEYDFATGALRQIGQAAGAVSGELGDSGVAFTCLAVHQGYLYAGVGSASAAWNSNDAGIYCAFHAS